MPERNILDMLANVAHWTGWPRHLRPLSGSEPKLADPVQRYILTIFAYGCNLGPTEAARHMLSLAKAHELPFTNRYVSIAQLEGHQGPRQRLSPLRWAEGLGQRQLGRRGWHQVRAGREQPVG